MNLNKLLTIMYNMNMMKGIKGGIRERGNTEHNNRERYNQMYARYIDC